MLTPKNRRPRHRPQTSPANHRGTRSQIQTPLPFRKTRKIPQYPKAGNQLEKFPVMLRLDGPILMVVILGQFEMRFTDFLIQR